jgi:transposase
MQITTIGLDLAKHVFQVHAVDAAGAVVVRRALRRAQVLPFFAKLPPCLIGIEACGTSHHWARELIRLGHEVRLMPPAYVKPYVKRGKTDAADAEVICEAVTLPTMRLVGVKSCEQQAALSMHRGLLVKQRTQLVNMMRGLLAEFGIDIPQGLERALLLARQVVDGATPDVPVEAVRIVGMLSQQALADPGQFRSGRQFAAWLGLTPLQNSSGGKQKLGRISKMGDKYLRKLLVIGATSLVRRARHKPETVHPRLADLLARKPVRVATVAMANKMARIAWAIMTRGEIYQTSHMPVPAL